MRVLGHIHAYNDGDVIERSVRGLLAQSYPLEEVLVVDNASEDDTLRREFAAKVTVIRHPENRGTSGAVKSGFEYAMMGRYDWIWLFDADSVPRKDALQRLLEVYRGFPPEVQERVWRLSSLPMDIPTWGMTPSVALKGLQVSQLRHRQPRHGIIFTSDGYRRVEPGVNEPVYECHASIWTGSLVKVDAVMKIGLPAVDYVLDYGEYAYSYHAMRSGYRMFMHQGSIVEHNVTGAAALSFTNYNVGLLRLSMVELPPSRCYYVTRNTLYFWLYEYHHRSLRTIGPRACKVLILTMNFLLRPYSHRRELVACLRGIWDGLRRNMHRRY